MKSIVASVIIQTVLIFTFLFDPSSLNVGADLVVLPQVMVVIATLLGNVAWVYGAVCMFATVVFCTMRIPEFRVHRERVVTEAVAASQLTPNHKGMAGMLVVTGYIIFLIGVGSGFWFTGTFGLLTLMIMTPFRADVWDGILQRAVDNNKS